MIYEMTILHSIANRGARANSCGVTSGRLCNVSLFDDYRNRDVDTGLFAYLLT